MSRFSLHSFRSFISLACCLSGLVCAWLAFPAEAEELTYAPTAGMISSKFGWRKDPFLKTRRFHGGLDIAADRGTPVFSVAAGEVVYARYNGGFGNVVVLRHNGGLHTLYAHNDSLLVKERDIIRLGQPIAKVGSTGRATGPHLHFEVHDGDRYMDPEFFLLYLQQELTLVGALPALKQWPAPVPRPPAFGGPDSKKPLVALHRTPEQAPKAKAGVVAAPVQKVKSPAPEQPSSRNKQGTVLGRILRRVL